MKCINCYDEKVLDELIKIRNAISIIENYVKFSGSKFGEEFLKKCKKRMYDGVRTDKKALFDSAFDLYQKLSNEGIADRWNYMRYNFVHKLVQDDKDTEVSKIFSESVKKAEKALDKLQNPPAEESTKVEIVDGKQKTTYTVKRTFFNKVVTTTTVTDHEGKVTTTVEEKPTASNFNFIDSVFENINRGITV